jgi:hypothetical protein
VAVVVQARQAPQAARVAMLQPHSQRRRLQARR